MAVDWGMASVGMRGERMSGGGCISAVGEWPEPAYLALE